MHSKGLQDLQGGRYTVAVASGNGWKDVNHYYVDCAYPPAWQTAAVIERITNAYRNFDPDKVTVFRTHIVVDWVYGKRVEKVVVEFYNDMTGEWYAP